MQYSILICLYLQVVSQTGQRVSGDLKAQNMANKTQEMVSFYLEGYRHHLMVTKVMIKYEYIGLEHRQTLRACISIVMGKLKLKMDNLKFRQKIGNLDGKGWKF